MVKLDVDLDKRIIVKEKKKIDIVDKIYLMVLLQKDANGQETVAQFITSNPEGYFSREPKGRKTTKVIKVIEFISGADIQFKEDKRKGIIEGVYLNFSE